MFKFGKVARQQIWDDVVDYNIVASSTVHLRMQQWKNYYKKLSYRLETGR